MSPRGGTTHITCPMLHQTFTTIYLIWQARNSRVMLIKLHLNISIFQYFRAGSYFHITDCFCLFTFIDSKGVSNFTFSIRSEIQAAHLSDSITRCWQLATVVQHKTMKSDSWQSSFCKPESCACHFFRPSKNKAAVVMVKTCRGLTTENWLGIQRRTDKECDQENITNQQRHCY